MVRCAESLARGRLFARFTILYGCTVHTLNLDYLRHLTYSMCTRTQDPDGSKNPSLLHTNPPTCEWSSDDHPSFVRDC